MIPFIPFGTTYNDMLVEFVSKCYVSDQFEQTVKTIKATFKKLTGYSINHLVDDYSYQEVIDKLSNAKIPHCSFAYWLRKYEWQTPQQSENGERGACYTATTTAPKKPKELTVKQIFTTFAEENGVCSKTYLQNFVSYGHFSQGERCAPHTKVAENDEIDKNIRAWLGKRYPQMCWYRSAIDFIL